MCEEEIKKKERKEHLKHSLEGNCCRQLQNYSDDKFTFEMKERP